MTVSGPQAQFNLEEITEAEVLKLVILGPHLGFTDWLARNKN